MSNKKRLVCIVDDDVDILNLYYDALKGTTGIKLFKFSDPLMALEHIRINKNSYALIISDLRMPELNGIDLIKKVKTLNNNIRSILVTAFDVTDIGIEEHREKKVLNGFIQKPIKITELRSVVKDQLQEV